MTALHDCYRDIELGPSHSEKPHMLYSCPARLDCAQGKTAVLSKGFSNWCSLATGILLLACAPTLAHSQSGRVGDSGECRIPSFPAPTLCARAGLDTIPASYLFVVDESGSMRPLWGGVRSALANFAEAIPDRSELDVRLFAGAPRERIPATAASPATRRAWSQQLSTLQSPAGGNTDLGRAAENAVAKLSSAPADRLQFVFFLTDGRQEPAPGSPYAPTWNAAWESLRQKAQQVVGSRPVKVSIIRLTPEADVSLLQRVFPDAIVTDALSAAALRQWFNNQVGETAVNKLRLAVAEDLERPAAIITAAEPLRTYAGRVAREQVRLESGRRIVSTKIAAGTPIPLPSGGQLVLDSTVVLEPGVAVPSAPVAVTGRAQPFYLPPDWVSGAVDDTLPVRTSLRPENELALIGISQAEIQNRADRVQADVSLAGGGALSWPAYLAAVAVLLLALVVLLVFIKWKTHRAYLPGQVLVRRASPAGDSGPDQESAERFKGRRVRSHTVHLNGDESLTFEAQSERGKTVVYAIPRGNILVRGKPVGGRQLVKSATTFESPSGQITYIPR